MGLDIRTSIKGKKEGATMTTQEMSGIQGFTTTEALDAFGVGMLDATRAKEWVNARLHPEAVPACPACAHPVASPRAITTFNNGGRVCCLPCKKFFTNRTNTILHGSNLPFEVSYLVAVLSAFAVRTESHPGAARREIARITGMHTDSVHKWQRTFAALETALV